MSRRSEILTAVNQIDALPVVAAQMIPLLRCADATISDIAQKLSSDPGLTANTLRLANCALHATNQPVTDVGAAIKRLGTRRLMELVLASSIAPMTKKPVRGYDLDEGQLWRHSMLIAIGAEELAAVLDVTAPSHTFTAGLLADIGKIVLGTFVAVDAQQIIARAFEMKIPFDQAEREVLGIDHAEVGAALLSRWQLPSDLVDVARWHHQPENCPQSSVVALVHAADHIGALCGVGAGTDGLNYLPCESTFEKLNISTQSIEQTLSRTVERLEEVESLFVAPIGSV